MQAGKTQTGPRLKAGRTSIGGRYQYLRIAGQLRRFILKDGGRPRRRLPPERSLAEKFRVARPTIRQALKVLEDENLIRRRQGSGTAVNPVPPRRIPLMIDYTGSMHRYASRLKRRVISFQWLPAGARIGAELRLQNNAPVLYAERIDSLEGRPIACDRAYIAPPFSRRLTRRDLAHVDFIETWERRSGFRIAFCRQFVDAVRTTKDIAKYLKMPPSAPLLKSTEIYYASKNMPAGLYISFYNPGVIRIASLFQWPAPTNLRRRENESSPRLNCRTF